VDLPKPIYENLPYAYFVVSGAILFFSNGFAAIFSAALFYAAGSIVLVTRSANRRLDNRHKSLKHRIPENLYEYLPFVYGAVALFCALATTNELLKFVAFVFGIIALKNIVLRHNNRHRKPRKL